MREHSCVWAEPTEEHMEGLVERTMAGDVAAWKALWLALAPSVERAIGRRRLAARKEDEDDARKDVVVRVFDKIRNDRAALLHLRAHLARRDASYRPWLACLVRNTVIDHFRQRPERLGPRQGGGRRWAMVVELAEEPEGEADDPLQGVEAHRILEHAARHLAPAQIEALRRWARRDTAGEIAVALGLEGPAAATRLVRSAIARLRAVFAPGERNRLGGEKSS